MKVDDITVGEIYSVNSAGDLYMNYDARPFIGHDVKVVQRNKNGKYLVELPDGRRLSVALFNLSPRLVEDV